MGKSRTLFQKSDFQMKSFRFNLITVANQRPVIGHGRRPRPANEQTGNWSRDKMLYRNERQPNNSSKSKQYCT